MLFFIYAIIGMQVIPHPWGTRAAGGEPASEGARVPVAAPVTLQLSRCLATSALMGKTRTATRMSSKLLSTITSGPSSRRSCFSSGEGVGVVLLYGLGLNLSSSCVFVTLLTED